MAKHHLKFTSYLIVTILLTLGLSISLQSLLAAWNPPTNPPPAGNLNPPIYNEHLTPATNAAISKHLGVSNNLTVTGGIITGDGSGLTNLDSTELTGTVSNNRLDADLQDLADGSLSGSKVGTGINADNLTSGTVLASRVEHGSLFITSAGTNNYVWTSDGAGAGDWKDVATLVTGDDLGDHTADQNIILNSHWLSGDGGNEGIYIDNAGRVGIGITNLFEKLRIKGSGNQDVAVILENTDALAAGGMRLEGSPDRLLVGTFGGVPVEFLTSAVTRMTIDTLGNVGIGEINPSQKLDVAGAIQLGASASNETGVIRWTGTDFEGYDGSEWISLTGGASINYGDCYEEPFYAGAGGQMNQCNNGYITVGVASGGYGCHTGCGHLVGNIKCCKLVSDIGGGEASFGSWMARAENTVYQAATDGFVIVHGPGTGHGYGYVSGYFDSSNPPVTLRARNGSGYADVGGGATITMPVKKDHYWKVTRTGNIGAMTVYWLPLGN
jgi:hypothetical protein